MNRCGAAAVALVGALAIVSGASCVHAPPPEVARLRVIAEPDVTSVYIDDEYAGRARVLAKHPKALRPGVKYITFTAPDHFPHDVRVKLLAGETTIRMKLRPVPP
jgi:hypothetical protein